MTYRRWFLLGFIALTALAGCNGARWSSGDRVLVSKCTYDSSFQKPERFHVVVFKYPKTPIDKHTPKNYIKRLWGLPGEILAIFFGRVYGWAPQPGQAPPYDDQDKEPGTLWQRSFMHDNEEPSRKLFEAGAFKILRKPPDVLLALRRIVYDNDYQAKDLINKVAPRWNPAPGSGWKIEQVHNLSHDGAGKDIDWLRYQHLLRPEGVLVGDMKVTPKLITDVMGYNSYRVFLRSRSPHDQNGEEDAVVEDRSPLQQHWVGDLMLECQLDVIEPKGEFVVELSKGIYRFQAHCDLATGKCTLYKVNDLASGAAKKEEIGSAMTRLKTPGSYQVRFANIDARLTLWVDRDLPFNDGIEYAPPEMPGPDEKGLKFDDEVLIKRRGPTRNDLEPASLGSKGARLKVNHLRLWRDTYYTTLVSGHDFDGNLSADDWGNPDTWGPLRRLHYNAMYVQPGHYLVMGDNSANSSDSRDWGTVPDRLLLGRALVVYYPFLRAGAIR